MSRDKNDLHAELVTVYDQACAKYKEMYPSGPQPFITCTHRSDEEQNALFEIGRTKPGKTVTNAKAGQSPHNFKPSFAFDIAFITIEKKLSWDSKHFKHFAEIINGITNTVEWGGEWKFSDPPHFELKAWKNFKDLKHL